MQGKAETCNRILPYPFRVYEQRFRQAGTVVPVVGARTGTVVPVDRNGGSGRDSVSNCKLMIIFSLSLMIYSHQPQAGQAKRRSTSQAQD